MGAGDTVTADDLVSQRVRFVDDADLDTYFAADDELPADLQLRRGVGAGELLPRAAVGPAEEADTVQLPVAVDTSLVPPASAPARWWTSTSPAPPTRGRDASVAGDRSAAGARRRHGDRGAGPRRLVRGRAAGASWCWA